MAIIDSSNIMTYAIPQQYALSAGIYHFKCPLCANTERFVRDLMHYGIQVPFRLAVDMTYK